ncbi:hypothetical protein EGI32_20785 [Ferruginibacter sp. HRS2-29]|nr:hypothetical protein [Ferruginibacter sp. HRS2-29]
MFSCNSGSEKNTTAISDTANVQSPAAADNAGYSAPQNGSLAVTPFEMKDDSVFVDGSVPASWENAGFTDVKAFKLFLKQAQLWIMDNDKQKLASIVRYPLKNIKTPEELVEKYDAVFTKDVKLSFATINFNQIFRNQQGASTEGGKVWFAQQGKDFKIIAVNY